MIGKDVIINENGRYLHGRLFAPKESGCFPCILICHGYNSCKEAFFDYCEYLSARGVIALSITFCGGSTRDESGFPSTSMTLETERDDAIAGIEYLKSLPYADKNRVFLFGESMGGMAGIMAAQKIQTGLSGLILLYPALCIAPDWKKRIPDEADLPETIDFWGLKLGRNYLANLRTFDIFDLIPEITLPVLIFHGEKDKIVPVSYAVRAAQLLRDVRFMRFPSEGHGFGPNGRPISIRETLRFINRS